VREVLESETKVTNHEELKEARRKLKVLEKIELNSKGRPKIRKRNALDGWSR